MLLNNIVIKFKSQNQIIVTIIKPKPIVNKFLFYWIFQKNEYVYISIEKKTHIYKVRNKQLIENDGKKASKKILSDIVPFFRSEILQLSHYFFGPVLVKDLHAPPPLSKKAVFIFWSK